MPDRRGSRFLLEVVFLIALAAGLTFADRPPLEIAGVMLVGWVIVAALEWAAWRTEPHYGSGLPPRYYVPRLNLPPPQPLEQVAPGYPEAARDEAPTWIASAALREKMLGDWPMASPAVEPERGPTEVVEALIDPAVDPAVDPWLVAELPAAPLGELEPEPVPEAEPVPELEPVPEAEPAPEPVAAKAKPEPPLDVVPRSVQGVARYNPDPLADPPPPRRFGRGGEAPVTVEVPARPEGVRSLPGRLARED